MSPVQSMTLTELNALTEAEASAHLVTCCAASRWVEGMVRARPFASLNDMQATAATLWQTLAEPDYLAAFEGHPKIGDVHSLRAKYAQTHALAAGEQQAVQAASEATLHALAEGNARYERQNGFIFIVFATGKSAEEMLHLLTVRLQNTRSQELAIAAEEQAKITALRIEKLICETPS